MPDQNSKPIALLIYANTGAALDSLKPETEAIESHLKSSGLCDVRIVPAYSIRILFFCGKLPKNPFFMN